MKKEIEEILFVDNKFIRNRFRDDFFYKNHPVLYNKINEKISDDYTFKEKIYIIYNDIELPTCKMCNKKTKLISFSKGFSIYCSKGCVQKDIDIREKVKETNIKKFGAEFPLKSEEIKEKLKKTNRNKYGVDFVLKSDEIKEKIKKTNLEKYGVQNPFQSSIIKKKIKETNLEKYGVEHNSKNVDVVLKRKKTFLKKYGVDNPNKNKEIIHKRNKTITINYVKKYSEILNISENNIKILNNGDVVIYGMCNKHKSFKINKQNLFNRLKYGVENICTKCNKISGSNKIKENEIVEFISNLNVKYVRNNRKLLKNKEIDIYLEDYNIGIEFNGLYWHSSKFHENNYHYDKTNICEKNGIQLLQIFEDEWIFKRDIVKSIIKSKLNLFEEKIYGRQTKIKIINDNYIAKKFLEENHIQGYVKSSVKIGLYYNDALVSIMTFGKKRISTGNKLFNESNEYEMIRYCTKLNTIVIGGASKLLKYFIKTYNPHQIITFADRRYSNGDLYMKLGFNFIHNTKPNYWYFNRNDLIRYHRFNFRKDVLIKDGYDSSKTEHQIMDERGFFKIYDCGNMKFILSC